MNKRLDNVIASSVAAGQAFRNLELACEQTANRVHDLLNPAGSSAGWTPPESEDE